MKKYILILILIFSTANAQDYKSVVEQILTNNNEIKAYAEQINSTNLEKDDDDLPLNPEIEYSFMSGNSNAIGDKHEFVISQAFDFPSVYFLRSDVADMQETTNEFYLYNLKEDLIKETYLKLNEYVYNWKKVEENKQRLLLADNLMNTIQIKYEKGDIGALQLNKSKAFLSLAKMNIALSQIELDAAKADLVALNGGVELSINLVDYPQINVNIDFKSLHQELVAVDPYLRSLESERELNDTKISLAKSAWLPSFAVGYKQEKELEGQWRGVQLQLSIPFLEDTDDLPYAQSQLSLTELKIMSYKTKFKNDKSRLFKTVEQYESTLAEQKNFLENDQLELNLKAYELGHISLNQYYIDNTIFYEIKDTVINLEKYLLDAMIELNIEKIASEY
jgi:outer membrane protein, heavy metal efflux system